MMMKRSIRAVCAGWLALAAPATAETPDVVARRYGLAGELLVARGDTVMLSRGYGTIRPSGGAAHRAGQRWRLASITKQVTAALLVRDRFAALDTPIDATDVPAARLTLRQLLTHHSGLPNPDATPAGSDGVPAFYKAAAPDLGYCRSAPARPGADFSYNNCDYLLAAQNAAPPLRWPAGMAMARPGEIGVPGFVGGRPEPAFQLASFGAAGGLMGTARAVFRFDRALMTGTLLSSAARGALWTPEGGGSAQALGQWVFTEPLKGCAVPVRIVQRDGEIHGMQARNFILPDVDRVVIVFTNRASGDFALGEVWQGRGFAYDLLSAAACG